MDKAKQSIRVVVVDDEPAVADSLAMILRASGYESIATYSAEEALALCQTMDVHVVVSDIVMGPMSGFDLAIWLAENRPASRIILMSGYSFHDPLVAKSVRRGFDFLRKPIQLDKFLAKIANAGTAPDSPAEPMQETTATEE